ncbi:MAG: serine/threonine protein kinase [Phycisphaerales bacterium]|nr:serine/threonine protein kinase [Phycisphaerales bacterium]
MRNTGIEDHHASNHAVEPPLEQVARGAPGMGDELLAERIEVAGASWLAGGRVPGLSELLASIPVLRSSPIALDAAIDVVLQGLLAGGLSLEASGEAIRADTPELTEAIDAHLALKSLLGHSIPDRSPASAPEMRLPVAFGPTIDGGGKRYELVEFIGSGSEGRVFRAFDRRLNADGRPLPVAVKTLSSPQSLRRVHDEATRATRVRHTGIAALLDCGQSEDGPYLVSEFVEGVTLDRWCRQRGVIPSRDAAEIVRQLAEAAQAAHNAGVVHRDLKPTNVLVTDAGQARITDFGLAAALSAKGEGSPTGSLAFAAPEQLLGEQGAADASVDVYALGGLLYWLLTARYPNGNSAREIYANLAERRFPGTTLPPKLPRQEATLGRICSKALAPDPGDRHSSAAVLAQDLARWLAWEPVLPFDASSARRIELATRRSPLAAATVGVSALVMFGAIGVAWRMDAVRRSALVVAERERSNRELAWSRERLESQRTQLLDTQRYTRGFMGLLKQTYADSGRRRMAPRALGARQYDRARPARYRRGQGRHLRHAPQGRLQCPRPSRGGGHERFDRDDALGNRTWLLAAPRQPGRRSARGAPCQQRACLACVSAGRPVDVGRHRAPLHCGGAQRSKPRGGSRGPNLAGRERLDAL